MRIHHVENSALEQQPLSHAVILKHCYLDINVINLNPSLALTLMQITFESARVIPSLFWPQSLLPLLCPMSDITCCSGGFPDPQEGHSSMEQEMKNCCFMHCDPTIEAMDFSAREMWSRLCSKLQEGEQNEFSRIAVTHIPKLPRGFLSSFLCHVKDWQQNKWSLFDNMLFLFFNLLPNAGGRLTKMKALGTLPMQCIFIS